jgi:hypothetical protein
MSKVTFKDFLTLVGGSVITFLVVFFYLHFLEFLGI